MSRGTTGPLEFYPQGMYPPGMYPPVMYPQGMYPQGMYPPPSSLRSPVKKPKQYSGVVRRIPYSKHVQPNKKYEPIVKWENELNIYDNKQHTKNTKKDMTVAEACDIVKDNPSSFRNLYDHKYNTEVIESALESIQEMEEKYLDTHEKDDEETLEKQAEFKRQRQGIINSIPKEMRADYYD